MKIAFTEIVYWICIFILAQETHFSWLLGLVFLPRTSSYINQLYVRIYISVNFQVHSQGTLIAYTNILKLAIGI